MNAFKKAVNEQKIAKIIPEAWLMYLGKVEAINESPELTDSIEKKMTPEFQANLQSKLYMCCSFGSEDSFTINRVLAYLKVEDLLSEGDYVDSFLNKVYILRNVNGHSH